MAYITADMRYTSLGNFNKTCDENKNAIGNGHNNFVVNQICNNGGLKLQLREQPL